MTKQTFLYNEQLKLGAKMVSFAGWQMPVQYAKITEEHMAVRQGVGLFDVSHMGEFFVSGKDSLKYLQTLVPQDISKLIDGKAVYCQLLNESGGIIDDLIIYKLSDDSYFLVVNAGGVEVDFEWMLKNKKDFDAELINSSQEYSLLAVQGPKAPDVIEKMGLPKDSQPQFFNIKTAKLCGVDLSVSRTGYTGEDGFELLVKNEFAPKVWNDVLEAGKEFGIMPVGLGARDTLRLEAALNLYGNEMNETTTPIESGLLWTIAKNKEEDYIGKSAIMNQLKNDSSRTLIGFKMTEKSIARHGYEVWSGSNKIGEVTSGGVSPVLSANIGLALVNTDANINIGAPIQIKIREKLQNAVVVKRPFIEKKNKSKQ